MDCQFSLEEICCIFEELLYWCFCWVSGLVLVCWLVVCLQWVCDKCVLDFGSGFGVVVIVVVCVGVVEVVVCDLDFLVLVVSWVNVELNGVELSYLVDFFVEDDCFDLILVVDVFYDCVNLLLFDQFFSCGCQVLVVDLWVCDFCYLLYWCLDVFDVCIWLDFVEFVEFCLVSLYYVECG